MTVTNAINTTQTKIIDCINNSGLHPSICKLILLNVIKTIEEFENSSDNTEVNPKQK